MSVIETIREQEAASACRAAYRKAYQRLVQQAQDAMRDGYERWAEEMFAFADAAYAAYRKECQASGVEPRT